MTAPAIWMQTLTGRAMDLMYPSPAMVDLTGEVAEVLARLPRFGGHVASGIYSVAQHCVLGADVIQAETGDWDLTRAYLLHDAHEAYMGDIASPVAEAIRERTGRAFAGRMQTTPKVCRLVGRDAARDALRGLKQDLDAAIHTAAGMDFPLSPALRKAVHEWDLRMLQVERAHLLPRPPHRWHPDLDHVPPAPLRSRIRLWPWPEAADAYRARLITFFPHLAARAA